MKIRDIFKKVETYNEVAEIMQTTKAEVSFGEFYHSERFDNYEDFRKYVRREYITEFADKVLKFEEWEIDSEKEIEWSGGTSKLSLDIVSKW